VYHRSDSQIAENIDELVGIIQMAGYYSEIYIRAYFTFDFCAKHVFMLNLIYCALCFSGKPDIYDNARWAVSFEIGDIH